MHVTKVNENSIEGRLVTVDAYGDLKRNKDCENCFVPPSSALDMATFEYSGEYEITRFNLETWSLDTLDKYGNILSSQPSKIMRVEGTFKQYISEQK